MGNNAFLKLLPDMVTFLRVAELGSFSAAAAQLGITPSAASRQVTRLEKELGVQLMQRTTRQLRLTAAGVEALARCGELVTAAQGTMQIAQRYIGEPRGQVSISAPKAFARRVLHPLPPAPLAPTLWIGLGPVGVAVLAPLALARAGQDLVGAAAPIVALFSQLAGTAVWGFGLWWLALALTLLVRYLRTGPLPFHLGWWAFTFPLGAFTVATLTLARAWQTSALEGVGVVLYLMLVGFWGVVAARTIAATRAGRIWAR